MKLLNVAETAGNFTVYPQTYVQVSQYNTFIYYTDTVSLYMQS